MSSFIGVVNLSEEGEWNLKQTSRRRGQDIACGPAPTSNKDSKADFE